ncbi:MAG: nuclear transport factor 2 family protein [Bacteroidota bacterium]
MKSTYLFFCLLLALAITSDGLSAQTYSGKTKEINKILANIKSFSQYYMNGETDKLVACYTEDGKILPVGRDIMEGTATLRQYWDLPEGIKVLYHKVTPTEIRVVKDVAYDYGYYEGTTQGRDGSKSDFSGKYVIVWKKVNKEWKIYLDMWSKVE